MKPTDLLDDLLASARGDAPLRSVWVGAHWTAVCSRSCGLAATLQGSHPHASTQVRDAGQLHLMSARQLAEYARSADLLEASIGIAALNSMIEVDESQAVELNAGEVLAKNGRGKKIALVGHFPFIPRLKEAAGELWVIEQNPTGDEYPADSAADLIPRADLVAITGSALINGTLAGLLALCRPGGLVMVLGPTTPLSPVLFEHGATLLSGSRVVDEEAVLRTISQGASFRQVQGVRLVNIVKQGAEKLWNF